ncbi:GAF domain-containing protein [Microbacterium sulfonylureivorans]|uniref:GAF domain-containing protein n=1 Tax=Microbacterium sulfonylureivorans TaxID=2486854 RepID=UPI000FDC0BE7|nr:GAF domain-containing protein [Microbacterium sulfonylureivorans]
MSSPWSQRREVSPETSRLLIERAHEELLAGNAGDERLADVRALVRESWRRSLESLVGAEALPPLDLDADALDEYRRLHPLAGVIEMVRGLLLPGGSDDSGVAVAVGDAAGRLLWVEGDRRVRTLTGDMGFVEGANWSERAVGTSAPGTAIALDRSVQIRGAEHFNRLVQPWSCTAAPVHDPETRRLLGVIDVTGGIEAVTPQAQLLVDATARAIEGELLVARLRARADPAPPARRRTRRVEATRATLRVLGRDRALLEVAGDDAETVSELGPRHAELLLMLAVHRQGLSAERLGELVYGDVEATVTLRAEMVRLRKVLERVAPALVPESRPYRLGVEVETDAHQVLSLLDRGAHRVALAAYRGDVLPDSVAPGIEAFRDTVRTALREALMAEASVEVLLAFAETDAGSVDVDLLRLCLSMLPPRSPKRAGLVARIEKLQAE